MNEIAYILFVLSFSNLVSETYTAYLRVDQPHFKASVVTVASGSPIGVRTQTLVGSFGLLSVFEYLVKRVKTLPPQVESR